MFEIKRNSAIHHDFDVWLKEFLTIFAETQYCPDITLENCSKFETISINYRCKLIHINHCRWLNKGADGQFVFDETIISFKNNQELDIILSKLNEINYGKIKV